MGSRAKAALLAIGLIMAAAAASAEDYRLNPGDVLRVSVWREEGLERELLVQPDGTISFPLAGQVAATNHTVGELEAEIAQRLERYIPGPVVTVELIEARGNIVYVLGEVNSPGAFQLARPTTVMQALSQAGGLTPFAGRGRIRVVRKADGAETVVPFHYGDVADGDAADVELRAGDVVIVPGGSLF
jgi:polysaccharide biosynthesis/export protein